MTMFKENPPRSAFTMPSFPLQQALHVFKTSLKLKSSGIKQYPGNATQICSQIIKDCFNGQFFQTSTTHFPQFWTRDFGFCTASLLKLGYKDEVNKTLNYALNIFSKHNKITTTISLNNKPFNFPTYAVDSLPWLTHSLTLIKNKELITKYKPFLEKETKKLFNIAVNQQTGLVKPKHFSSIKDFAIRKSSCYDNCMLAFLSNNLNKLKLTNPLRQFSYKKLIAENFWNGSFFYDDLNKLNYIASDANIFPFYLNIITNKKMLSSAINSMQKANLDKPFPVKYTQRSSPIKFIWSEIFIKNYELDSIWMHMSPFYLNLLKRVDKKQFNMQYNKLTKIIETYKNYLEVFSNNGKPFKTLLYHADQGMLWAANYLTLK